MIENQPTETGIEEALKELRDAAELVLNYGTCSDPDCCPTAIAHAAALGQLRKAVHFSYPPEDRFDDGDKDSK